MRLTRLAIATAPALFVLLWSTGFIGARYGLPYIEPLTFLAVRMAFTVLIRAGIALAGDARWPPANEVSHSLVAGSLVHGLGLGGVFTAISQGVPAGICALIMGLQPILTSTVANRFMGEKVTRLLPTRNEGALPVIPSRSNAIRKAYCPKRFYRQRHKIENFFCHQGFAAHRHTIRQARP
jgi:hypothetical protein